MNELSLTPEISAQLDKMSKNDLIGFAAENKIPISKNDRKLSIVGQIKTRLDSARVWRAIAGG